MFTLFHCPDCASAQAARATIMDDPDLWVHLLCVIAPFVPLALVAGIIYKIGRITGAPERP